MVVVQGGTQQSSALEELKAQVWELKRSLDDAQRAEAAVRRDYQALIDRGVPRKDDFDNMARQLDFETLKRKKADAELDHLRRVAELRNAAPAGAGRGDFARGDSMVPRHGEGTGATNGGERANAEDPQAAASVQFTPEDMHLLQVDNMAKEADKVRALPVSSPFKVHACKRSMHSVMACMSTSRTDAFRPYGRAPYLYSLLMATSNSAQLDSRSVHDAQGDFKGKNSTENPAQCSTRSCTRA